MAKVTLRPPFLISSRLLPSLKVADATISLFWIRVQNGNRKVFKWYIDLDSGEAFEAENLSHCGTLQDAFCAMLDFLDAESDGFPAAVNEWAAEHRREIQEIALEIDPENGRLIEE